MITCETIDRRLALDPRIESARIEAFLREHLDEEPRSHGYVVGLSGGIDSSVAVALARRALSADAVLGVLLPERESMDSSTELARDLGRELGIEMAEEDLTATLATLGVYERREAIVRSFEPRFEDGWSYRLSLPGDLRHDAALNVYRLEVFDPDGEMSRHRLDSRSYRAMAAATCVKQRLRMLRLYEHAEARGFRVCGTTNRTELLQGFFVRYGDGGVDIEPLGHLYKAQVVSLARHLEIDEAVISRPPSPDTYSAPVSDEEFFFRLPYPVLDAMLAGFEAGVPTDEVALAVDLDVDRVERIYGELERRRKASRHALRNPPSMSAAWEQDEGAAP